MGEWGDSKVSKEITEILKLQKEYVRKVKRLVCRYVLEKL